MRRQLNTIEQTIRRVAASTLQPKIRRAFLTDTYPSSAAQGGVRTVAVTLSDPTKGTRGLTFRASVRAGLSTTGIPAGTPVTIIISHGQAEILSVG